MILTVFHHRAEARFWGQPKSFHRTTESRWIGIPHISRHSRDPGSRTFLRQTLFKLLSEFGELPRKLLNLLLQHLNLLFELWGAFRIGAAL